MKVNVITRHAISNYGSLLQALATQKVIESFDCECQILNYIPEDENYKNISKTLLKKNIKWNKNFLYRIIYLLLQFPEYYFSGKFFEKNRKRVLNLTQVFTAQKDLENYLPTSDVFCTGSDQVWGPISNNLYDSAYFLNFVKTNNRKIAYAASFGKTNFDQNLKQTYKNLLKNYDDITVREDSASTIVKELTDKTPKLVLDPTLLLDSVEWSRLISLNKNKKYVLIYQLHKNKMMDEYAKNYAKKAHLPLIRISASFHQIIRSGKFKYLPNISNFLSFIKNAECLITDSFHGTAFAINFGVQFIDILPEETKTRNQSLLRLTGLTDRILQNFEDYSFIYKTIDYEPVNKIIEKERVNSKKIFKSLIFD
ncbi:MAG: hypothetical protein BKP49_07860 [Treponema sp. CETP13]|nr:MAG: hypothetical protein BKP49_07860 [Treponema sp. CETP13]